MEMESYALWLGFCHIEEKSGTKDSLRDLFDDSIINFGNMILNRLQKDVLLVVSLQTLANVAIPS